MGTAWFTSLTRFPASTHPGQPSLRWMCSIVWPEQTRELFPQAGGRLRAVPAHWKFRWGSRRIRLEQAFTWLTRTWSKYRSSTGAGLSPTNGAVPAIPGTGLLATRWEWLWTHQETYMWLTGTRTWYRFSTTRETGKGNGT